MADNRPILLFDSGVGGLSVLDQVRRELPDASIVYAADNAGYPYGIKSELEIASRVPALLGRLVERFNPRIAIIACNTASTIALSHVRAALDLLVIGTVPAIKPAALASKTRVIGILGTDATVRQPYVDRLSAEFADDCVVIRHGSAELVEIAERKLRGQAPDPLAMARVMDGLFGKPDGDKIDQLVLSCTHFPLLADEIAAASPSGVTLVDSGKGIARRAVHLTEGQQWPDTPIGVAVFSKDAPDLEQLGPTLLSYGLSETRIL